VHIVTNVNDMAYMRAVPAPMLSSNFVVSTLLQTGCGVMGTYAICGLCVSGNTLGAVVQSRSNCCQPEHRK